MENIKDNAENVEPDEVDESTDLTESAEEHGEKYLTFYLSKDVYGINIDYVREVENYKKVYNVPKVPEYIRGIINLRGDVIPVIDLCSLFFGYSNDITKFTSIVILEIPDEDGMMSIGFIIDSIKEVVFLSDSNLNNTPDFGLNIDRKFVSGVGKLDNLFVMLLDVLKIIDVATISVVENKDVSVISG